MGKLSTTRLINLIPQIWHRVQVESAPNAQQAFVYLENQEHHKEAKRHHLLCAAKGPDIVDVN